jgi:hypothetical protein
MYSINFKAQWLFNRSMPNGHVMHQQVKHSRILHSAHTVFMCFIFISEQMAAFAPVQNKLIGFYNQD